MIKWDRAAMQHLDSEMQKAIGETAEAIRDDVREEMIVPRAQGTLQNEAFEVDTSDIKHGIARLVFNTPYARRLYFHPEYHFRKDQNPNAQGQWMAPWLPGGRYQHRASQIFAAIIKRRH